MKKFSVLSIIMAAMLVFSFSVMTGCGTLGIPKTYVMKETGKEMSKDLARVYQVKVKSELVYKIGEDATDKAKAAGAITDWQAYQLYKALCAYNDKYLEYCTTATSYYDSEMAGRQITTKAMADALVKSINDDRDLLAGAYKTITGKTLNLPLLE